MPTPSLKEFAQATPVCSQTSGLADLLEIFSSSGCHAIVVVSPEHCPLGVVNLPKVMPHLLGARQSGDFPLTMTTRDGDRPICELEPPIIEPLAILPAQLSLSQFWPYLQESEESLTPNWGGWVQGSQSLSKSLSRPAPQEWAGCSPEGRDRDIHPRTQRGFHNSYGDSPPERTTRYANIPLNSHRFTPEPVPCCDQCQSSPQHWALVDEQGKFSGLLNSWRLLKSLAPNTTQPETTNRDKQPQPTNLKPLVQLLEHLPLPLSIQTTTGQVLAQNLIWRQQIGTSPNLDWVRRTTAAMLDFSSNEPCSTRESVSRPDGVTTLANAANQASCESLLPAPRGVKERGKRAEQAGIQSFCAMDTPRLTTTVSTQQVILSAPVMSQTQESSMVGQASSQTPEALKNSQERVFSFVKIPLSSAVFEGEKAQAWEDLSNPNSSSYPSSISDLCVVLAQDTTEQQQVTKELAAKNADLIHLNRLKDEFLACISHELKTPLTAVLGLSTLLKDQALGELNERQARYARLIYQSGRQLMTLVNDILDLTRMETGQLELSCEPVQIQSVCDRAYSQAGQLHQEKEQQEDPTTETQFTLEIEPGLDTLVADELRLRQMLVHLLSNALKFTDVGGKMGLRVNRWEGWIAFTVWDTGIGIPPEKQHLIFQKFQQLEQPLTRRFEGTGLGLVLTQRLARLHGGDVSFISKPGEGSQFTLLLPPCPPQSRGVDGEIYTCPSPHAQCPIRNRLVLIVETVPRYLDSLTEQLKSLGYRVVIARSGTEAIEKARGLQPCAILLNPLLPQLSGWDVLTLLKSDAQTRHIPVLVTATQAEKQQAYQNKADGFLSLPVQKPALLQSLTGLEQQERPTTSSKGLTILHLSPVEMYPQTPVDLPASSDSSNLSSGITELLSLQHSDLNYRVLEADDLEQAELLARVWQPDVVLLNAAKIADSLSYLEQFSLYPGLLSIPLVTLDHQTTEAANQVTGLSVYPCLAPDNASKITALLQVLQVAAGISYMPSILVMDIGEQGVTQVDDHSLSQIAPWQDSSINPLAFSASGCAGSHGEIVLEPLGSVRRDLSQSGAKGLQHEVPQRTSADSYALSSGGQEALPCQTFQQCFQGTGGSVSHVEREMGGMHNRVTPQELHRLPVRQSRRVRSAGGKGRYSQTATPLKPQSSWLQALMQYLQTAGFRSVLSGSWTEIYHQLQEQSVDLLLIRIKDISDASGLVSGLLALTQLQKQKLPPILVLDHRLNSDSQAVGARLSPRNQGMIGRVDSTSTLDSVLTAVATQILRGNALSMTQLLEQINQALGM
ncbi:ATP-binding response regulator [Allocoleopsis franciscana]|uniref:histidine kinase n=1 Tax=Allocoleopsis franciscana PCC 7113 TaxID=1173027 RepID=K9W8R9_9CYAN|nr:hybrid sensor histidine kinase/response regulator [Allocoleopsis franciscana]AFZ16201.1 signal transduction histidine kinase [Allocoleopsis franciscana PCC 7113]